jgi:chromosome segregation ATPase
MVDFQGDISAFRKRLDEYREKTDLNADTLHRMEIRLNELLASESDRRINLGNYQETQTRFQAERDRLIKELEDRLSNLKSQNEKMDGQIQDWEASQRAVKRAKDSYEEIAQKFDRRINEITEMQRLAEDRFRQEWITFKADDQKRWTSYTLSQDEIHKDSRSGNEKMEQRLSFLEDLVQTHQDMLQQTKDANEQMFQGMLSQIHELLASYERIMGAK